MGENAGIETGSADTSQGNTPAPVDNGGGESTGGNPAWSEILGVLPDSLHPVVQPALEKWDRNYQNGIQKVHSDYAPWKQLTDAGYDPQTVQYALQVIDRLENDPRSIYDALAEHNGWAEQGQTDSDDESYDPSAEVDPRLLRAEQMSEAVAEYVMSQHQQQQQAQEDAALDAEISGLVEKHGLQDDPNIEKFALGMMLSGATAEQAFQAYIDMVGSVATRPRANDSAPVVLGSGGGVPSGQISREQLRDPKARKGLVQQLLHQANAND